MSLNDKEATTLAENDKSSVRAYKRVYDGSWSCCWKVGNKVVNKDYLKRTAPENLNIDWTFPLTSEIKDGYQTMTFGYYLTDWDVK